MLCLGIVCKQIATVAMAAHRPQRGSRIKLIVGDQAVIPCTIPTLLSARSSRPIVRPTPRITVRFHVHPMLRA